MRQCIIYSKVSGNDFHCSAGIAQSRTFWLPLCQSLIGMKGAHSFPGVPFVSHAAWWHTSFVGVSLVWVTLWKLMFFFTIAYRGVDKAIRRLVDARNLLLWKKRLLEKGPVKMMPMYRCQIKLAKIIPLEIMYTATICQWLYFFSWTLWCLIKTTGQISFLAFWAGLCCSSFRFWFSSSAVSGDFTVLAKVQKIYKSIHLTINQ